MEKKTNYGDKLSVVYSLLNQYSFKEAKNNLPAFKDYYMNDPVMRSNKVYQGILSLVEKSEYEYITDEVIAGILTESGKTEDEVNFEMDTIKKLRSLDQNQIKFFKDRFHRICNAGRINKANVLYGDDPIKYTEFINEYKYIADHSEEFIVKSFTQYDIRSLVASYQDGVNSSLNIVNNTYYPIDGWPKGQLVMLIGAPGTGKSLMLQQECVHMLKNGQKCFYLAMGDLTEYDLTLRLLSQFLGKSMKEVSSNIISYYEIYNEKFKNLYTLVTPAATLSVDAYIDIVLNNPILKDAILFIDYDLNFLMSGESMYKDNGYVYDKLTTLTKDNGNLLFIASQPKQAYNRAEEIPADAGAESSRKYQIADAVVTLGRLYEGNPKLRMGVLNLGKVRREGVTNKVNWVGCCDGTIYEVPKTVYEELKSFPSYFIDRATLDYKVESSGIEMAQGTAEIRNQLNGSNLNSIVPGTTDEGGTDGNGKPF